MHDPMAATATSEGCYIAYSSAVVSGHVSLTAEPLPAATAAVALCFVLCFPVVACIRNLA